MNNAQQMQDVARALQNDPAAVQQFQAELQKIQVETVLKTAVSQFQKICFQRCVEQISSNRLSGGEEKCMYQCAKNRLQVGHKVTEVVQGMISQSKQNEGFY